jgi:hypothetical protein
MSDPEEKQERGFRVIDRRGGGEEGEAETPAAGPASILGEEPAASGATAPSEPPAHDLPKIDFATFVLSLFTSALVQMGVAREPGSDESAPEPDLLLAQQTIDTLEMLEAKTRGNLDPEEAHLLENALYELRMRFVEAAK